MDNHSDKNKSNQFTWLGKFTLLAILLLLGMLNAKAQSGGWDLTTTNGTTGLTDHGNGVIQLLDNNASGCASAAVHETSDTYDPTSGSAFTKCYQVYFGCPGNDNIGTDTKGDGLAFSFSKCAYNINNGLSCGGGLGYMGSCPQMVTIEFDTWSSECVNNFDCTFGGGTTGNNDEIAIHINGDASDAGKLYAVNAGNLEDGLEHAVCITYDPATQNLSVSIDENIVMSYTYNLDAYFGVGGLNQTWSSGKHGATNPATVTNSADITDNVGGTLCPASVVITSPGNGDAFEICDGPITITAESVAPAGNTVDYLEFFVDGISIGTDNSAPYSIAWDSPTDGNHAITAVAHYVPSGTSLSSSLVNVNVSEGIQTTTTAPVIDGTIEALWGNTNAFNLNQVPVGTIAGPADVSATYQFMRDDNNLYILVDVSDDDLQNDGGDIWDNDGVEIFIDMGNDKSTSFGANDFQYAFVYNSPLITEYKHNATAGVTFSQGAKAGGYYMEISIPWSNLGGNPANGDLIGFDVHVNDDDGGGLRDSKIAWNDATDIAHGNPSGFGTVKASECNPCPEANAGTNQNLCNVTSTTLAANTPALPAIGTWTLVSGPNTPSITSLNDPNTGVTGMIAGTYEFRWTVTKAGCSDSTSDVKVTISAPPVSNAGTTQNLCEAASTTLAANSVTTPATGVWTLISGPNTPTITTTNDPTSSVTGMVAGTYVFEWTVSNGVCTAASSQVTVVNSVTPTSVAGTAQGLCNVTSTTLAANTPVLPATGTWTLVSGPNAPTLASINDPETEVTGMIAGTYEFQWTVSNGTCSAATSEVTVTISAPPVSNAGTTQNLCEAASTTLAANSVTAPASGVWTLVSGPNTPTITTTNDPNSSVTGMVAGTYVFEWTVSNGTCTPAISEVIIVNSEQPVSVAGATQNLCNAATATLDANLPASPSTGMWTLVSGPNTPTITNANDPNSGITGLVAGTYEFRWTVSNGSCTAATSDHTIENVSGVQADAGTNQNLCEAITASLAGNNPGLPITGAWTVVSGPATVDQPADANSAVTISGTGEIVLEWTLTGGACANTSDQVIINNYAQPTSSAGIDQDICEQSSITLAANSPVFPATGTWFFLSGPNTPTITNTNDANAEVTGMVTGMYVFQWTVSNGVCSNVTSQVTVNNIAVPVAHAGTNQSICSVTSTDLNANPLAASSTGTWTLLSGPNTPTIVSPNASNTSVTDMVTGTYVFSWTVTNGSCADASSTVTIVNSIMPSITSAGLDQATVCADSTVLSADNPASGTSGIWKIVEGEFDVTDLTNPTTTIKNIPVGTISLEWITMSGACEPARDTVVITRHPAVTVASAGADRNICATTLQLAADTIWVGTGTWSSSNPSITFMNANEHNTIASGLTDGTNQLIWTVTGSCGAPSIDTVLVTIGSSNLMVDVNTSMDTLCAGTESPIEAIVSGSTATPFVYTWFSSDGILDTITNNSNFTIKPLIAGWTKYFVSVVDANGCAASPVGKDSVYAIYNQELVIPNLITPNGDHMNDCLIIRDVNNYDIFPGSQFHLYNRWGQAVYRNNYYKNEDFCGDNLSDGIYYYNINTSCDRRELRGWLQIISGEASNR